LVDGKQEEQLEASQRHRCKMKSRTAFTIAIGLLILGLSIALFTFSTRNQAATQIFAATINRDCAPWDGAAFTVSIPMDNGAIINISIWHAPDIKRPATFSFPDITGQVGNAAYLSPSGENEQLSGKISFQRVGDGNPVEGEFRFTSQRGEQFNGKFKAEWGNRIVMCG
jgi:hypothetical protein